MNVGQVKLGQNLPNCQKSGSTKICHMAKQNLLNEMKRMRSGESGSTLSGVEGHARMYTPLSRQTGYD